MLKQTCHPREGGDPLYIEYVDSLLQGNDRLYSQGTGSIYAALFSKRCCILQSVPENADMGKTEFITDKEIYDKVILEEIPAAKKFVWIATSDIKDLHVKKGRSMVPFLEVLSDLVDKNVLVRLIHAKEPGPNFRKDFDRYPNLIDGLERILCPRVHFKSVIVDGTFVYTGSANLTGAGMGAKSSAKRNFEGGIISSDTVLVKQVMKQFDNIWMGSECTKCRRKEFCADYEMLK